jgi:hypothetical protein
MLALGGAVAVTAPALAATPRLVQEPRIGGKDFAADPTTNSFTLSGYVEYKGGTGNNVRVEVCRVPDTGNGFPDPTANCVWQAAPGGIIPIATTCDTTKSPQQCKFSKTTFTPFTPQNGDPFWLTFDTGGVGSLRVHAFKGNVDQGLIPTRDASAKLANSFALQQVDFNPTTADFPGTPAAQGGKTWLSLKFDPNTEITDEPQTTDTDFYYQSVLIDETLVHNIFFDLFTLTDFKNNFMGPISGSTTCKNDSIPTTGGEVVATYYNDGDLGLGRKMHCQRNACRGYTACYVDNFGGGGANAPFDDFTGAKANEASGTKAATVAMVERDPNGPMNFFDDNGNGFDRVFFVVYDANGFQKNNQFLDNFQKNIHIPSNCLTCHGVDSQYSRDMSTDNPAADGRVHQALGAVLLPWDLQSFKYWSTTSTNSKSRAAQESSFKNLNKMISKSNVGSRNQMKRLMAAWYGADSTGKPNFSRSTFLNNAVPSSTTNLGQTAWNKNDNTKQLYVNTYAHACRTCHTSSEQDSSEDFQSFTDYQNSSAYDFACQSKVMPQSQQAARTFWRSSARAHLLNRLSITQNYCNSFEQ